MNKKIKNVISFDLSSGDGSFFDLLNAVIDFLKDNENYKIIAFLTKKDKSRLEDKYFDINNLEFVVCENKIEQTDGPLQVKRKPNSTLIKALKLVIDGEANLLISSASSGPLVASGYLFSKPINQNFKPAFSPIAKSTTGKNKIFLDVGANIDVDPQTLEKYAIMGSIFSKTMNFSSEPRVSLLNIGEEISKGNKLLKKTYQLLKENDLINFIGNVEPNKILLDNEDVIVSDALSGNIYLKSYEGAFEIVSNSIKESISSSKFLKLFYPFYKKIFTDLKSKMNSKENGGALILGLNHLIIKSHGNSSKQQILNSLNLAKKLNDENFINKIREVF